jgi:hypothetical protein
MKQFLTSMVKSLEVRENPFKTHSHHHDVIIITTTMSFFQVSLEGHGNSSSLP